MKINNYKQKECNFEDTTKNSKSGLEELMNDLAKNIDEKNYIPDIKIEDDEKVEEKDDIDFSSFISTEDENIIEAGLF
jgi:hypothetical protein